MTEDWTPNVIIGRADRVISCSEKTIYRRFKDDTFDIATLPVKCNKTRKYLNYKIPMEVFLSTSMMKFCLA